MLLQKIQVIDDVINIHPLSGHFASLKKHRLILKPSILSVKKNTIFAPAKRIQALGS
jgi:hypothetical protein